jgi:hypothetical protein
MTEIIGKVITVRLVKPTQEAKWPICIFKGRSQTTEG